MLKLDSFVGTTVPEIIPLELSDIQELGLLVLLLEPIVGDPQDVSTFDEIVEFMFGYELEPPAVLNVLLRLGAVG
jgi:hypothetical protein